MVARAESNWSRPKKSNTFSGLCYYPAQRDVLTRLSWAARVAFPSWARN